jgi:hypothetical protein
MDEAKTALAEARRLNPKLTVKWMIEHTSGIPAVLDGLHKARLPEERSNLEAWQRVRCSLVARGPAINRDGSGRPPSPRGHPQ